MSILHSKAPPLDWYTVVRGNTALPTSNATILTNLPDTYLAPDGTLPAPYTVAQRVSGPVFRPTRVGINGLSSFLLGFRATRLVGSGNLTSVIVRVYGRIPGATRWFPHASTITCPIGATNGAGEYTGVISNASMMYPEMFIQLEARTYVTATDVYRLDWHITE